MEGTGSLVASIFGFEEVCRLRVAFDDLHMQFLR